MTPIPIQLSVRLPDAAPAGEWPDEAWKASVVARDDWRPFPFRQFIVKLHSRCNLSCDYCYLYEMADQTWRTLPGAMNRDTLRQAARRIGAYAERHALAVVEVIFHGGEPLLVGPDFVDLACTTIAAAMPPGTRAALAVQTNGVLLTDAMLRVLSRHDVGIGVSIDGGPEANDRHRRYANGKGSHRQVADALARVNGTPEYRRLLTQLICTVDVANDPVGTYEALLEFAPPSLDFLLPLGNWTTPPPARPDLGPTPYGDWMSAVFDRWYGAPRQETEVRMLQAVVDGVLGLPSRCETIGLSPAAAIEVETDGSLQQVCTLKSTYDGAACTGLSVFRDDFDAAMDHPAVVARQATTAALADECTRCPVRDICGGGYYAHRYRAGSGFRNRSVYCADLMRLIGHVRDRVTTDLARLTGGSR